MLSTQCSCFNKDLKIPISKAPEATPKIHHQVLDQLIQIVHSKAKIFTGLGGLVSALEKIKKGHIVPDSNEAYVLYDSVEYFDEPNLIKQLIENGYTIDKAQAQVAQCGKLLPSLLQKAVEYGHLAIAEFLVGNGSKVDEINLYEALTKKKEIISFSWIGW